MLVKVLKSKLHRARVTDARLHYPGSIEIAADLMEAAGIVCYESVIVADLDNGNRLETYVVPGQTGSARIVILGAAAQLVKSGDRVIILGFAYCTAEEAAADGKAAITAALADSSYSTYVKATGTFSAGRSISFRPRVSGMWACIWLSSTGTWAYEGVTANVIQAGAWRP